MSSKPGDPAPLPPEEAELWQVPEEAQGQRLDRFVQALHPEASRAQVQAWVEGGAVWVAQQPARKAGLALKVGQWVAVMPPEPAPHDLVAEDLPLNLLHEDEDLIVVHKAAGMVVHPAAGHATGTLVNALLHHAPHIQGVGAPGRPGIVHRLDKDTSGLMVVALNEQAHRQLQAQLADRSMGRLYLAGIAGRLPQGATTVDAPIARDPRQRLRMAVLSGGRQARTHLHPLVEGPGFSLLGCKLDTGRTHQIRVHLSHLGRPLMGDRLYGGPPGLPGLPAQALHAWCLRLIHPRTGAPMAWLAEPPAPWGRWLASQGVAWPPLAAWPEAWLPEGFSP